MVEVGLLISLGVVMGFLMSSYGAVQRIVQGILKVFGRKGSSYAFGLTLISIISPLVGDLGLSPMLVMSSSCSGLGDDAVEERRPGHVRIGAVAYAAVESIDTA